MTTIESGRYLSFDPMWTIFGRPTNATLSSIPARSNAWGQKLTKLEDGALAGATEVGNLVAVPVQEGDAISKVTLLIGATAEKAEAGFAALYIGKKEGKLLGQSKSAKFLETIEASKAFTWTLEKPVVINNENAPGGFVYVVIALESETQPTALSSPVPKACQYAWFTNTPEQLYGTVGSGLKTAAETTLGTVTSAATGPFVFLT